MPFFSIAHTTMYYDVIESDFTTQDNSTSPSHLLLIHGFGGTPSSDFAGQLPLLRHRYRVIAPHLRGYGRSTHRVAYTLTFYQDDAADLAALLHMLGISQTLVVGFSDGGIVGLLLAAHYPQLVSALAVMGAQPTITTQNTTAIRHWLLEKPLPEDWQTELAALHGDPYWRALPSMYVKGQDALVAAGGIIISDAELASITCPTLIMHGKRDRIVPAEYASILHEKIAGSEIVLFDAGHAAHLRCEQEYTSTVLDFLRRHDR